MSGQFKETLDGYIEGEGGRNFRASFLHSGGLVQNFHGRFSSAIPEFRAISAKLESDGVQGLHGNYEIDKNATIGPTTVNLPLVNNHGRKALITGTVDPSLPQAYSVTGSGTWQCI